MKFQQNPSIPATGVYQYVSTVDTIHAINLPAARPRRTCIPGPPPRARPIGGSDASP